MGSAERLHGVMKIKYTEVEDERSVLKVDDDP